MYVTLPIIGTHLINPEKLNLPNTIYFMKTNCFKYSSITPHISSMSFDSKNVYSPNLNANGTETEISQNEEGIQETCTQRLCFQIQSGELPTGLRGQIDIGLRHKISSQVLPIFYVFLLICVLEYFLSMSPFLNKLSYSIQKWVTFKTFQALWKLNKAFANSILGNTVLLWC